MPACTECGACCLGEQPDYIRVWAIDLERMDGRALAMTAAIGEGRYLRFEGGRCAALELTADGAARCTIYPMRPDACRALERGSGACRAQLDAKWHALAAVTAALGLAVYSEVAREDG